VAWFPTPAFTGRVERYQAKDSARIGIMSIPETNAHNTIPNKRDVVFTVLVLRDSRTPTFANNLAFKRTWPTIANWPRRASWNLEARFSSPMVVA
jgi:hypothetical protein